MNKITSNNLKTIFVLFSCFYFLTINAQIVTTFAGSTAGFANGTGTAAQFSGPQGVAVATDGTVYITDISNHRIRKITPLGVVTTFAGGTEGFQDGTGTTAKFDYPSGVAVATDGTVFVADINNNRIRKITPTGVVTTLAGSTQGYADGTGITAQFYNPTGVAVATDGTVFVADYGNNRIRKITPVGMVTTFAGSTQGFADDTGAAAQFNYPFSVAVAVDGIVYVGDMLNERVRKITPTGVVTTLAGSTQGYADGTGITAQFNSPVGLAVATDGTVFIADGLNNRIRKITASGVVTTFAGSTVGFSDGTVTDAQFNEPYGVALYTDGTAYVTDFGNNRIRKITNALSAANFQLENQVLLYPNPASKLINIKLVDISATKATILDINGRILQSENIIENNTTINISNLDTGIYFIQITTDKGTVSKKIVKR